MSTGFFRRVCFFIALFLLTAGQGFANDLFQLAEFYYGEGRFDEAVTEYLRYLFFYPGNKFESEAHLKIARCRIEAGDWGKAEQQLALSISTAQGDAELHARRFFRVEFMLARARYMDALDELALLESLALSREERMRRFFLLGLAKLYLRRWEEARTAFSEYFAGTDTYPEEKERRVIALLSFAEQVRYKDPDAARVMSYIIPGSGQIYAGDFFQGVNSLLVTGLAAALVIWAIADGNYLDAAVAGFFVFQRFYFGSPFHADRIAYEYNENRKNTISHAILRLLE